MAKHQRNCKISELEGVVITRDVLKLSHIIFQEKNTLLRFVFTPIQLTIVDILIFLQKIWSWWQHSGFYRPCISSPQRWPLLEWTSIGYCEKDEGDSFCLPKQVFSLLSAFFSYGDEGFRVGLLLDFETPDFTLWRVLFWIIALCRIFSTFCWRIALYLSFVWPWRASPGMSVSLIYIYLPFYYLFAQVFHLFIL